MRGNWLGIDTSNYTSSIAVSDASGVILSDKRKLLQVKEGGKGLRQSDALFQHWDNLPALFEQIPQNYLKDVEGICVSTRPRNVEGSYMPVFKAGISAASLISKSLDVPVYEFSHQEGHLLAACIGNEIDFSKKVIFCHFSGGTLEQLLVEDGEIRIFRASNDISYGQLLDRIGVDLGYPFPAGKYMDELAMSYTPERLRNPFCPPYSTKSGLNLSGIENQLKSAENTMPKEELAYCMMERVAESIKQICEDAAEETGAQQVLLAGGVSTSGFIRNYLKGSGFIFAAKEYCSDNAAGLAYSRGERPWL